MSCQDRRDEIIDIPKQQIPHVSRRHTTVIQMRFHRPSKVARLDKNPYVRKTRRVHSFEPGLQAQG